MNAQVFQTIDRPTAEVPSPAWEVFASAFAAATERLIANVPKARDGAVEGVHQARSAGRALRGILWTFRPLIVEDWAARLDEELSRFVHALGVARDLDVFQIRLRDSAADLAADLELLFGDLRDRRESALDTLIDALDEKRIRTLVDRLKISSETRFADPETFYDPDPSMLARLARRAWKAAAKLGRSLDESSVDQEFHDVRKRIKRARYAVEAILPGLSGRDARRASRFARRLEMVQDVLGEHQDAVVARDRIAAVAASRPCDATFHLAAGRLLERQDLAARVARSKFFKVWPRLDQSKLTNWG